MRSTVFGIVVLTALALLASAVTLAPTAAAEKSTDNSTDEGENAWVEDCPPDMMCAFGGSVEEDANTSDEGENAWVEDCPPDMMCAAGSEDSNATDEGDKAWVEDCPPDRVCAYNDPNQSVDNSSDAGSNCMDGEQEGETCDDNRHYMTPPDDGREPAPADSNTEVDPISAPADDEHTTQEAGEGGAQRNNVPAFTMLAAVGLVGSLALALGRQQ